MKSSSSPGKKTYIVSIYRQDDENQDALAGIVEEAGNGKRRAFNSFEDLRQILNPAEKVRSRGKGSGACRQQPE